MPKAPLPLLREELRQKVAMAHRFFKQSKTRFGETVVQRNLRIVQALQMLSQVLPREVELAALFYQLPPQYRNKLPFAVRRLVDEADELSASSHDQKEFLTAVSAKDVSPSAVLINMASAISSLDNPHVPEEERERIAKIVLHIHAPLVDSLGLHWVSTDIGNMALRYAYPVYYEKLVNSLFESERQFENILPRIRKRVRRAAEQMGVHYETSHGIKQPYSAYRKLITKGKPPHVAHLTDSARMRVVIHHLDPKKCYELVKHLSADPVLAVALDDDYIRRPKPSGYQSLHLRIKQRRSTRWFELQVRTHAMHAHAEGDTPSQFHHVYKMRYIPNETRKLLRAVSEKVDTALKEGLLYGNSFRH